MLVEKEESVLEEEELEETETTFSTVRAVEIVHQDRSLDCVAIDVDDKTAIKGAVQNYFFSVLQCNNASTPSSTPNDFVRRVRLKPNSSPLLSTQLRFAVGSVNDICVDQVRSHFSL